MGGGSGGHVTPVVAVINQLVKSDGNASIRFWCDPGFFDRANVIMKTAANKVKVEKISAGKFRRYNHLSFSKQLLMPSIVLPNISDSLKIVAGFFQSLGKLIAWRPDVIFLKGGFVCLPVGLAATILRIPFVIHDSDAHPGLTNRILARYATKIATGAPLSYYNYPRDKSNYTGIPVDGAFKRFTPKKQAEAKRRWGVSVERPLIVITGGGLGAKRINQIVYQSKKELEQIGTVILLSGKDDYPELSQKITESESFRIYDFVSEDMAGLLGAADVVVARAGATSILELAALAKPTILIPNARLTGGHQLKNANVYKKEGAAVVLNEQELEANPHTLAQSIAKIINNKKHREQLSDKFHQFAKPQAAEEVAGMVVSIVKGRGE